MCESKTKLASLLTLPVVVSVADDTELITIDSFACRVADTIRSVVVGALRCPSLAIERGVQTGVNLCVKFSFPQNSPVGRVKDLDTRSGLANIKLGRKGALSTRAVLLSLPTVSAGHLRGFTSSRWSSVTVLLLRPLWSSVWSFIFSW